MKKNFPLTDPDNRREPPRVVEMIKADVRKYLKRERRKPIAKDSGIDFWDFDCRAGKDESSATDSHVDEVIAAIDKAAADKWPSVYIEILAKPGKRRKKPRPKPKLESSED